MTRERCSYCGTDLELANEMSLGFGHSTSQCREYLFTVLRSVQRDEHSAVQRANKLAQRVGYLESALAEIAENCEGVLDGKLPHFTRRDIAGAAAFRARTAISGAGGES